MNALTNDSADVHEPRLPERHALRRSLHGGAERVHGVEREPGQPGARERASSQAINGVVDCQIRSQPNGAGLKYLVIVGGDQIIPLARLDDFTVTAANESELREHVRARTPTSSRRSTPGRCSPTTRTATTTPVPYLTRQLYIPNLAVGRLVETPEDIIGTLDRFVSTTVNGHLDPTTSLTTGYDFLYDGAPRDQRCMLARARRHAPPTNASDAPRQPEPRAGRLVGAVGPQLDRRVPADGRHGAVDHVAQRPRVALPVRAARRTTSRRAFGRCSRRRAVDRLDDRRSTNRLVFSMGCHAGLSVADSIVTAAGASTLDWPQAFAQKGVGAYLGNTGYGYGDSLVVAYSEELNRLFAQSIAAGSTVGNALVAAKQAYFGELGVFGVYDEKAMAEFTLYGLPMWSVSGPATRPRRRAAAGRCVAAGATTAPPAKTAAAPAAPRTTPRRSRSSRDPATGLNAETFSVDPTATPIANTPNTHGDGKYWTGPDGVQVTHLRPIQPKALVGADRHERATAR